MAIFNSYVKLPEGIGIIHLLSLSWITWLPDTSTGSSSLVNCILSSLAEAQREAINSPMCCPRIGGKICVKTRPCSYWKGKSWQIHSLLRCSQQNQH